jgi:DMSO reductase family type II enzyme heme b subunit
VISFLAIRSGIGVVNAQNQSGSIVSYRVTGAPDYAHPGSEAFWEAISWTEVPLAASVSPGGGHTPVVLVKSANDGFNIYVLFQWNDSVGPSYGSATEVYSAPNGTLVPLDPASTAQVKQLFYNSTYYYPDRVAMLWFLPNAIGRQQSPAMSLGSDGAITGGAAEIWHWQSSPTDNSANDTGFPGGYTDPSGAAIYPPDNVSFAEDDYTNTTGFYVVAGNFGASSPNLAPYADPFAVHAGNYFSDSAKSWTVEMVRSFTQSDAANYRVQLATGSTYYVAFAVWNGKLGESSDIKSVSQWHTLTISDQAPAQLPPPTPTQQGVTVVQAAATGVGLLIVGIIIGITVRPKSKQDQR